MFKMGCCYPVNLVIDVSKLGINVTTIRIHRNILLPSVCNRYWSCLQLVAGHLNTAKIGKKQQSLLQAEEWRFMHMVSNQGHRRSSLKALLPFQVTATC